MMICPQHFLKGTEENHKVLSQFNHFPTSDFKLGSSECKPGVPTK
jgi:hypothetical protein